MRSSPRFSKCLQVLLLRVSSNIWIKMNDQKRFFQFKIFQKLPIQIRRNHILQDRFCRVFLNLNSIQLLLSSRFVYVSANPTFFQHCLNEHPMDKRSEEHTSEL